MKKKKFKSQYQDSEKTSANISISFLLVFYLLMTEWGGAVVKNSPTSAGDVEMLVQSLGWEDPLEEGNPLHYSCLENPMDRGAWQAIVYEIAKS